MRLATAVLFSLAILAVLAKTTSSQGMDNAYFIGKWTPDPEGCADPNSEFLVFDDQGIFRASRVGQVESVGFWEVEDGLLYIHLLALPAFFTGRLQDPTDQLGYYKIKALLFDVEENAFDAAISYDEGLRRAKFSRCEN